MRIQNGVKEREFSSRKLKMKMMTTVWFGFVRYQGKALLFLDFR